MEESPYIADNVYNYDETRVSIADEGGVMNEKVSKECVQHRGMRGKTNGSLVSFVGAYKIVMMSVKIFLAKKEK